VLQAQLHELVVQQLHKVHLQRGAREAVDHQARAVVGLRGKGEGWGVGIVGGRKGGVLEPRCRAAYRR
jgi:hypothetical protein